MKYLSLPLKLLIFWYPGALLFWLRTWKNILLYLEEDLAVGLMVKLLFVPLFHDASLVGRILSFFFRLTRILIGLLTFLTTSLMILALALSWFLIPPLIFILPEPLALSVKLLLFSGVVLFIYHFFSHPPKKLWQLGLKVGSTQNLERIWQSSFISKGDLQFKKLLKSYQIKQLLAYLEVDLQNFINLTSNDYQNTLLKTLEIGSKLSLKYLGAEHFFVGMLSQVPDIEKELIKMGLKLDDFIEALDFFKKRQDFWKVTWVFDDDFSIRHLKGVNRGWLGVPTPTLDTVSEDLTRKAAQSHVSDFIGRIDVVNRVVDILSQDTGRNVILVGEAGSGKTALVEYLAKLIVRGDAPRSFVSKRVVRVDLVKLLVGVGSQGELAERISKTFTEAQYSGNIVIFIDGVERLGVGEVAVRYNLYSLLLPFIESSNLQFIATTDPQNYAGVLEKDSSFARLFTKVELPEASVSETKEIIKRLATETEKSKKIKTTIRALRKLVELTQEYVHNRCLPDGAIQAFEECKAEARDGWIKASTVEQVLQSRIKIPVGELKKEQKEQLLNLENIIHKKLVGQEEAVKAVVQVLQRAAVNLREKSRPIGSFLFVGPTGVGKTELSKILAAEYFEGKGQFLRLDMSEYQTPQSIERLIGKVGEEGDLTEKVRHNPYSLVLLDEFEKACPQILNLFLQVLEDGRLTDGVGRVVDFTNTIVIATSNAGSLIVAKSLSQRINLDQVRPRVEEELLQIFKPELINRFDEVVIFKPLSSLDLQKVVQLKLAALQKQLREEGYLVDFAESLVKKMVEKGFDPKFGARPLRRLIQDTIEARLSVMILENKLPKGERYLVGEGLLT